MADEATPHPPAHRRWTFWLVLSVGIAVNGWLFLNPSSAAPRPSVVATTSFVESKVEPVVLNASSAVAPVVVATPDMPQEAAAVRGAPVALTVLPPPTCPVMDEGDDGSGDGASPVSTPPTLVVLTGRPAGRSIDNALRAVARRLCPTVVNLRTQASCRDEDAARLNNTADDDVDDLAWLASADQGECALWSSRRPLQFPWRYFGVTVTRVCDAVNAEDYSRLINEMATAVGATAEAAIVLDVSIPSTYRVAVRKADDGEVGDGASRHKLVVTTTHCATAMPKSNAVEREVNARRRHAMRLRELVQSRDPFGLLYPLTYRYIHAGAHWAVLTGEVPSLIDPGASEHARHPLRCIQPDAMGTGAERRPLPLTVALTVTGLVRTLRATVPRTCAMMAQASKGRAGIDWRYIAAVGTAFPLSDDARAGLDALASDPHTAALLVLDTERYPTLGALEPDHDHGGRYGALASEPSAVATVREALLQYFNVAFGVMLRKSFEARCGARFDIVVRMRTDTYMMQPLTLLRLSDTTLWVDRDRDPMGRPVSLNDQWWAGPAWLVDPLADVYFAIPRLMASRAVPKFHAETLVAAQAAATGVDAYVRRPYRRIAELLRSLSDPIGLRQDRLSLRSKYCNRTHCEWPD